ncbi:MAG: IS5 family transposase [Pseudomonadota bacterium]
MRGPDNQSSALFSYVNLEERVLEANPLRVIKTIVDDALISLDAGFEALYGSTGRSSIAPERLLRASLPQAFFSVRSERQLMEQIDYNLLFRWFVLQACLRHDGLGFDDAVWDHSTFSKNRDGLLDANVAVKFLEAVLRHKKVKRFLSNEHFSVDGTLVEAWASMKSVRAKNGSDEPPKPGRNGEADFHGKSRTNDTHASMTDPDARLFKKGRGKEAKLCFMGHALMENRSGLIVQAHLSRASGTAEREAAVNMINRHLPGSTRRLTLGADKGYDAKSFAADLHRMEVTPHIVRHDAVTKTGKRRRSSVDGRTTRHPGYAASQRVRKRIEEAFGWAKMIAGIDKTKFRSVKRVGFQFTFAMAAYNLIRLPQLLDDRGG